MSSPTVTPRWSGRVRRRAPSTSLVLPGRHVILDVSTIGDGDPFDRSNPHNYSVGTGGAAALLNILVNPGDTIQLKYTRNGLVSDYAGVKLTINATFSGPEPGTLALLMVGGTAIALRRRKR